MQICRPILEICYKNGSSIEIIVENYSIKDRVLAYVTFGKAEIGTIDYNDLQYVKVTWGYVNKINALNESTVDNLVNNMWGIQS